MYNQIILKTSSFKFLGVIIDNNLTWHEHIVYIKKNIQCQLELFSKRENTSITKLYKLYTILLYFHNLIYCTEIWGNTSQTHIDPSTH